jgi:hypothetical protein
VSTPPVTQAQARALIQPLFEYLGVDGDDVSRVHFTAGWLGIEYRPYGTRKQTKIYYSEEDQQW